MNNRVMRSLPFHLGRAGVRSRSDLWRLKLDNLDFKQIFILYSRGDRASLQYNPISA